MKKYGFTMTLIPGSADYEIFMSGYDIPLDWEPISLEEIVARAKALIAAPGAS